MFKQWLKQFEKDKSERGELARFILKDETLACYTLEWNTINVHLRRIGMPEEKLEVFNKMWKEYVR